MFDPEKILQWSKIAQQMYGHDFWSNVFNSPQSARFFEQVSNMMSLSKTFPRADIYQSEREIIVMIDLPGVKKHEIQLHVADDRLIIRGVVQQTCHGYRLVNSERFTGKFERSIPLPELVSKTGYKASLRDGLLEVHLPRGFETTLRAIEIDEDEKQD